MWKILKPHDNLPYPRVENDYEAPIQQSDADAGDDDAEFKGDGSI